MSNIRWECGNPCKALTDQMVINEQTIDVYVAKQSPILIRLKNIFLKSYRLPLYQSSVFLHRLSCKTLNRSSPVPHLRRINPDVPDALAAPSDIASCFDDGMEVIRESNEGFTINALNPPRKNTTAYTTHRLMPSFYHRRQLLLCSLQILSCLCIDGNRIALLDE